VLLWVHNPLPPSLIVYGLTDLVGRYTCVVYMHQKHHGPDI